MVNDGLPVLKEVKTIEMYSKRGVVSDLRSINNTE
jgi:hypothetical protein